MKYNSLHQTWFDRLTPVRVITFPTCTSCVLSQHFRYIG